MDLLFDYVFAWISVLLAVTLGVKYFIRKGSQKEWKYKPVLKKFNRILKNSHIYLGIALLLAGFIHGFFSTQNVFSWNPSEIIDSQSLDVDTVSRATMTSVGIINMGILDGEFAGMIEHLLVFDAFRNDDLVVHLGKTHKHRGILHIAARVRRSERGSWLGTVGDRRRGDWRNQPDGRSWVRCQQLFWCADYCHARSRVGATRGL
jgi:hypothetical protein